ncbi:hypothetical protein [Solidesulfovibrio sp. C21]|uniref:hypothetical protein n=1 Tax=Solidesulfovibrio sp. C21 TaxID=3398613 RepID=UPI0039FC3516
MTVIPLPLWQLLAMAIGLMALLVGALMLGWRLGRESAGRPMFQATARQPKPTAASLLPDEDPWAKAQEPGGDA